LEALTYNSAAREIVLEQQAARFEAQSVALLEGETTAAARLIRIESLEDELLRSKQDIEEYQAMLKHHHAEQGKLQSAHEAEVTIWRDKVDLEREVRALYLVSSCPA